MPKKKTSTKKDGNPLFNFRLSPERAHILREVSKLYGAPSASAFAREIIMVVCSGRPEEIGAFIVKVQERLAAALVSQLAPGGAQSLVPSALKEAKKAGLKRKEGKSRG